MKSRFVSILAALLLPLVMMSVAAGAERVAFPQPATAYDFRKLRREKLGRGVFAFRRTNNVVRVAWRYKSSDPETISFNVYRDGKKVNKNPITDVTWFDDCFAWDGKKHVWEVCPLGKAGKAKREKGAYWWLAANAPVGYFDIELEPPKSGKTPDGRDYSYYPCDCSVGDLDGDGEYELVVIWWPTFAHDNSHGGQTGETWLEGVKLDGTNRSLWKICLGPNIRSGAHYVPVIVWDLDGDGVAEVVCRTADGARDGKGRLLVGGAFSKKERPFTDFRAEDAHVVFAPNYVTVFGGRTGAALDTIPFKPGVLDDAAAIAARDYKAVNKKWRSRAPGNQAFRFLSAVGYFDGARPSVVMCRGYYSNTYLTAYDWNGKRLVERWHFAADEQRNPDYMGQGFHNLRVGDVDFDGRDEIVYGHMCVDHDGKPLWTTGYGHGDALHLFQASPETRGLRVWTCHESGKGGVSLLDARTGRTLLRRESGQDTGACNALDVDPDAPGVELFSGTHCGVFSASTLRQHMKPKPHPSSNYYDMLRFSIWWMGDLTRSAYSGGTKINGYSVKRRESFTVWSGGAGAESNHGTKGCPCLVADVFGDWREELFLRRSDNRAIRVFMTPEPTAWRFHTFMEDPVYRISVATENCGYNLPSEPSFYFGPDLLGHAIHFRGTFIK